MKCPICGVGDPASCKSCGFSGGPRPDGIFESADAGRGRLGIDYPAAGNDRMCRLEESSYWFGHRNLIIKAAVRRWPWTPPLLDVGGGNGFQSAMLAKLGAGVVMIEPGVDGCRNAVNRGLRRVVRGTLESLTLRAGSAGAIALFDVLEHVPDRLRLLEEAYRLLIEGGRLYLTVPAFNWLWSSEDDYAEHKLRYTAGALRKELARAGFEIDYLSYFFLPLVAPVLALRTLPSLIGRRGSSGGEDGEHSGDGLAGRILRCLLDFEVRWLSAGDSLPFGTSLLCVARKPPIS